MDDAFHARRAPESLPCRKARTAATAGRRGCKRAAPWNRTQPVGSAHADDGLIDLDGRASVVAYGEERVRGLGTVAFDQADLVGHTVTNQDKFLARAFVLENTGVSAYLGQAGRIKNPAYLGAAATHLRRLL
jgi:hypothetical protein